MLIKTNRCQSQRVRAASMVCSSVQTKHINIIHFQEETVAILVLVRHASELQVIGGNVHCYTQNKKIATAIFFALVLEDP